MITWIQTVLQKHNKPVFGVLLIAIIIAFVFTIGSVPFLGDRNRYAAENKDFYGYNFSDANVVAFFETCVRFEAMMNGVSIVSSEQAQAFIFRQAFLLAMARDLGIKEVSQNELASYIKNRPAFAMENGAFNDALWKQFITEYTSNGRISKDDLNKIFLNNALVDKMDKLLGGPGYVSESEIKSRYLSMFGDWDVSLAILSLSEIKGEIKTAEADVKKYYEQNAESFRVAEGRNFDLIFLSSDEFVAQVGEPSIEDLAAFFKANANRYADTSSGSYRMPNLSEVKERVRNDYISDAANGFAVNKLEALAMKLYDTKAQKDSAEFKKILSESGLQTKRVGPVRLNDKSSYEEIPTNVLSSAIRLDDTHYYSDTVSTPGGAWIAFYVNSVESYIPEFEKVKEKAREALIESEKMRLFVEKGEKLSSSAVGDEKLFEGVMKQGGAKVETLKGLSFSKPSPDMSKAGAAVEILYNSLPKMKVGEVSKMSVLGDKGYIFRVSKYEAPSADENSEEYKNFVGLMKENSSRLTGFSVLSGMIAEGEKRLEAAEKGE